MVGVVGSSPIAPTKFSLKGTSFQSKENSVQQHRNRCSHSKPPQGGFFVFAPIFLFTHVAGLYVCCAGELHDIQPTPFSHARDTRWRGVLRVFLCRCRAAVSLECAALQYMGFEPEEFVVSEPKSAASKSTQRVIKKYPNRRLYDTDTSTYITLAEVRQLVMDHQNVVVRDAKTGEDLTRSILLQIILEEEAGGAPMFSEAVLANIIRFYGHAMQGFMGAYLEKNVQAFTDVQAKLAEQSQSVTPEMWAQFMNLQSPMLKGMMGNYVEQSQSMLTQMQEQMQKQTEQMLGAFGIKR